jgi:uncharacterized coiled-coil protein SlyX
MEHEIAARVSELERITSVQGKEIEYLRKSTDTIQEEVREKYDKLDKKMDGMDGKLTEAINGRPSWGVAFALSGLLSIVVGLATKMLAN